MAKKLTYKQWLANNPDIIEDETIMDCPDCLEHPEMAFYCDVCDGEGAVSVTYRIYEDQCIMDAKKLADYNRRMGLKQCRCGRWVKALMRMRWSDKEVCQACFEQLASEVRKDAAEHNYDRHYRWGQGL